MASDPITSSSLSLAADLPYPAQYIFTTHNPNSSTTSKLNMNLEVAAGSSSWYYRYWMVYMMPLVIVLGLVNNVISLLVFRSARMQLASRLKRYYEAIAVCDMFTIVMYELLTSYLGDGLALTTGGKFSLRPFNAAGWLCKLMTTVWTLSLQTSCYTLASLCVERALALCSPLRARAFLTNRWLVGQWLVINGVPNVSMIIMTFLGQNVIEIPEMLSVVHGDHEAHFLAAMGAMSTRGNTSSRNEHVKWDCQPDASTWIYPLYSWIGCGFLFFFHAVIMLVCSALITYKLLIGSRRKHALLAAVCKARANSHAAHHKGSSNLGRRGESDRNKQSDRMSAQNGNRRSEQNGDLNCGLQQKVEIAEPRSSPFSSSTSLRFASLIRKDASEEELSSQLLSSTRELMRDRSASTAIEQRNNRKKEAKMYDAIGEHKRKSLQTGSDRLYLTARQSYLSKAMTQSMTTQSINLSTITMIQSPSQGVLQPSPSRESPTQLPHELSSNRSRNSRGPLCDSNRNASREALRESQLSNKASRGEVASRKGRRRELRSAITVCTLAIFQATCYVPAAIICMAFCIASEYPNWIKEHPTTYRHIYEAHLMAKALTALSHVTNIYSYIACLPAFRRAILEALGFSKQSSLSGDGANSCHSVAVRAVYQPAHPSQHARSSELS